MYFTILDLILIVCVVLIFVKLIKNQKQFQFADLSFIIVCGGDILATKGEILDPIPH